MQERGAVEQRVSAVVVAYGPEPWLESCVDAVLASRGVAVDVVVVDNGGTDGRVDRLAARLGVRVVRPGHNTGFATGCNLGVRASGAPIVALVNPDARVDPDALAHLAAVAARPEVGIATGSIRLADRPERLNSAGNELHFLGLGWSGAFDEPATDHEHEVDVTCASGAGMALRREVWDALGGLEDAMFAYGEDADLSLRAWQRGLVVRYVPDAVVVHRYQFSRNATKLELLERNRLVIVLTDLGRDHLVRVLPALVVVEALMLLYALLGGWLGAKLAGYRWLVGHRAWLQARRRRVQAARTVPDRALAGRFATRLRPGNLAAPRALAPVDAALAAWWALVRRTL